MNIAIDDDEEVDFCIRFFCDRQYLDEAIKEIEDDF
jgi:hypothetical protein